MLTGRPAAVLSGVLLGLSFPPYPFPFLAWFAFVPLLFAWHSRVDGRSAFLDAYLALLVTFGLAFHWPLLHELPATALLSLPPLLVLPMWLALPFGLAHPVYRRFGIRPGLIAWMALIILAECGLRAGPFAFPWPLLGHTQVNVSPISGLAALGGVPLLTFTVLGANVILFLTGRRFAESPTSSIVLGLMVVVSAMFVDARADENVSRAGVLRVAGVQPALSPQAWADLADSSRVTMLLDQSRRAARSDSTIDVIVWPETAVPPHPDVRTYFARMQSLVDSMGIPILAGAITTRDGATAYRNSAVLSAPGAPLRTYDKVNLVPFAERVPFAGTMPVLKRLAIPAGGVSGYEPGENRTIFEIQGLRFGVLICFETLFADAVRDYARDGAHFVIAITQDGWWGDSFGYRQHLAFNRLRSIETGMPMIQAAVTGISALIHVDGRVAEKAGWMERAVWIVDVPPRGAPTPYLRLGDWVTALAALVAMATAGFHAVSAGKLRRTSKRRHET